MITDISDSKEDNEDEYEIRDLPNNEEDSLNKEDIDLTKISTNNHSTESGAEMESDKVDESDNSIHSDDGSPHIDASDISQSTNENKSVTPCDKSDKEDEIVSRHSLEISNNEKEDSNEQTKGRPKRRAAGAGVDRLEMRFDGKKYPDLTMKQFIQVTKIASQNNSERFFKKCVDIVFTQMNAKKGFRKYGKVAVSAVIKEFDN